MEHPIQRGAATEIEAVPPTQWFFERWNDGDLTNPRSITPNDNVTLNAVYRGPQITASAGANGTINPLGTISVSYGANQIFTITPYSGYVIEDVLIDGNSVGAVSSYTFQNVISDHTISALFILVPLIIENMYPPGDPVIGIDDIIKADIATNGGHIPQSRVYVLKKDGIYPWHSVLSLLQGDNLQIRAAYGDTGCRPQIWLYDEAGSLRPPKAMIVLSNNSVVSLKNLLISGFQEDDYTELDGIDTSLININGGDCSLYIDSCILKSTNASHIRIDGSSGYAKMIKVTNSIFADMGFLSTSSLLEGKAIDFQSGGADSCIVENNTFVNWQSSILNHFSACSLTIKYLKFDHNTLVNGVSYQGLMCLGKVANGSITITNNLLIDPFSLGNDIDAFRETYYPSGEVQEYGLRRLPWIHATDVTNTTFTISNNYYTISDSGAVYYNAYSSYQNEGVPLSHAINARLAASGGDTVQAFKKVAIQPEKVPCCNDDNE